MWPWKRTSARMPRRWDAPIHPPPSNRHRRRSPRQSTMNILGINAYHAGASACLIQDGQLVAAVEEERFRRIKYWAGFPTESIQYCLSKAGITSYDLDHVGISRDPSANLHKKVLFAL